MGAVKRKADRETANEFIRYFEINCRYLLLKSGVNRLLITGLSTTIPEVAAKESWNPGEKRACGDIISQISAASPRD